MSIWLALGFVIIQRLLELRLAKRNLEWALSQGAKEYGREHYPLFFLLHAGWMLGWLLEGSWRGQISEIWWLWLSVFILAQGLRYWAISSLGKYWNTRILIVPGGERKQVGPYSFLPHPNYLAVVLELFSLPMIFGAWVTAVIVSILNALLLLLIRIPAEEKALENYHQGL